MVPARRDTRRAAIEAVWRRRVRAGPGGIGPTVTPKRDAVGTAQLEPAGKIGRVAVLPQYRGTGIGGAMVSHLVDLARTLGLTQVHLNAQSSAIGFYARMGFQPEGAQFVEVGVPHLWMHLRIWHRDEEQAQRHRDTEHPHDRR